MSTTSIAHQPDTTEDTGSSSLNLYVTDHTTVTPSVFANGASLHIRAGDMTVTLGSLVGADAPEDLEVLDRFLHRCLDAVHTGRRRHATREAEQLPCGGVCKTVTWHSAGTWVCSAIDPARPDAPCTREEGHTGEHISCLQDDMEHTVRHTWTTAQAEVA